VERCAFLLVVFTWSSVMLDQIICTNQTKFSFWAANKSEFIALFTKEITCLHLFSDAVDCQRLSSVLLWKYGAIEINHNNMVSTWSFTLLNIVPGLLHIRLESRAIHSIVLLGLCCTRSARTVINYLHNVYSWRLQPVVCLSFLQIITLIMQQGTSA
jgi:hypothetical protein